MICGRVALGECTCLKPEQSLSLFQSLFVGLLAHLVQFFNTKHLWDWEHVSIKNVFECHNTVIKDELVVG